MRATDARPIDLGTLAPSLDATLGEYLGRYRGELDAALREADSGVAVSRRYSKSLDGLLSAVGCASLATARRGARSGAPPRLAVAAVGGYGRQLVALHSDVDVLFLCDDPEDPRVSAVAEGLLYPLWDVGLEIGHAVRGVEDTLQLARTDLRTATTLLDLRPVCGERQLVEDLRRRARRQVFEPHLEAFLDELAADTQRRHARYGDSLYLLEPEVKLGRGGLRDLDVAGWAAKARWGVERPEDYVRTGALLARELEELERAREILWRVRNFLHRRAGRKQDRLTFSDQEDIAELMGFVDGITLGVEQFMQAYYRHARIVAQTAERLLERAHRPRRSAPRRVENVGEGVLQFDDAVTLEDSTDLDRDPTLALRLYDEVRRRGLPVYHYARDAVARAAADPRWCDALRAAPTSKELFLNALTSTSTPTLRRGSLIGELHEVGLLVAMIPEFGPLTGRTQHDDYHVYTVDVHAVRAVDELAAFVRGDRHRTSSLACRLAAEAPRTRPLFLAVLLHDLAKAYGTPTGAEAWRRQRRRGAAAARVVAERLGLRTVDVEHVEWLVGQHLSFYSWATRRDIADPETVAEVVREVGTQERLRDLYLLNVAVVGSTNPEAMNNWKARMLADLYLAASSAMEGRQGSAASRASTLRSEIAAGLAGDPHEAELRAILATMPDRYILANAAERVQDHARTIHRRGDRTVEVALSEGPIEELSELLVVTDDRRGLLADVALVLASHRLSIAQAQIYTRSVPGRGKEAMDIFHLRREGKANVPFCVDTLEAIRADLEALLLGEVTEAAILARIPRVPAWAQRRAPEVDTEVVVDASASSRYTVIDVFTRDRLGLLHFIAKTLKDRGLSIALSKVSTEGAKVADVFYVQRDGEPLQDRAELERLTRTLQGALERYQQEAIVQG